MSSSDYLRAKRLRKRSRKDGRTDVVGTDITGMDYVALTTTGSEVTPQDVEALHRGDPERRDSAGFVKYFTDQRAKNQAAYEDAMQKDYENVIEQEILPGAFKHSPRQCAAPIGTKVSFGSLGHSKARCYFRDHGGCDWCY